MSAVNSTRSLPRSGAHFAQNSSDSCSDVTRSSGLEDFTQVSNSPLVLPRRVAQELANQAAAGAVIWESMRSFGRPNASYLECGSAKEKRSPAEAPSAQTVATAEVTAENRSHGSVKVASRARRNQLVVYELAEVRAAKKNLSARIADRERSRQRTELLDKMLAAGSIRTMAQPHRDWPAKLDALAQTYPNFAKVVEYLRAEFALRQAGRRPLGFAPFAVHGPPGIGKSVFMEGLADVLRTKFHRVQGETAQHSSCLIGTDKHWANSEAGVVFNALVLDGSANPLIYVDEIDKAGQHAEQSISSALYGLLEEGSAKTFRDVSMPEIRLNASHVQWVFAANDIKRIPAAIRSRWVEFEIPPMGPEDARLVVQSIYGQLVKDFRIRGLEPLADEDVSVLANKSPREMRILLRQAIAKAVLEGTKRVKLGVVFVAKKSEVADLALEEEKKALLHQAGQMYLLLDTVLTALTGAERILHYGVNIMKSGLPFPLNHEYADGTSLARRYPAMFRQPNIGFTFFRGWQPILAGVCVAVDSLLTGKLGEGHGTFAWLQIKEKFGNARLHYRLSKARKQSSRIILLNANQDSGCAPVDWDALVLEVRQLVNAAESATITSCMACGATAQAHANDGWITTFCAEHRASLSDSREPYEMETFWKWVLLPGVDDLPEKAGS